MTLQMGRSFSLRSIMWWWQLSLIAHNDIKETYPWPPTPPPKWPPPPSSRLRWAARRSSSFFCCFCNQVRLASSSDMAASSLMRLELLDLLTRPYIASPLKPGLLPLLITATKKDKVKSLATWLHKSNHLPKVLNNKWLSILYLSLILMQLCNSSKMPNRRQMRNILNICGGLMGIINSSRCKSCKMQLHCSNGSWNIVNNLSYSQLNSIFLIMNFLSTSPF